MLGDEALVVSFDSVVEVARGVAGGGGGGGAGGAECVRGVEELCDLDQRCRESGWLTGELDETSCRSLARIPGVEAARFPADDRVLGRLEPRTRIGRGGRSGRRYREEGEA